MKLSEYLQKLIYQKEVNTGYRAGFMGRVEHDPIQSFATRPNTKYNSGIDGLDLSFEDHISIDDVISQTYEELFNGIDIQFDEHSIITPDIKQQFVRRYWSRRLGFPTVSEFENKLHYYFMVECKNKLIQNYLLSTMSVQDFLDGGSNAGNNFSDTMQGNKSTPDGSTLEITNSKTQLLDRANSVVRSYGTGNSSQSATIGRYEAFMRAERTSLNDEIINGGRKLFLQLG